MASDGTFGTVGYNSVGDPYQDPQKLLNVHESRGKRQFVTMTAKKGQTASTFGSSTYTVKPLFSGEPYEDPGRTMTRYRMEGRKKFLTESGFKYSNPTKRSTGSGDNNGVLAPHPHISDGVYARRPKKGQVREKPRQIVTSPSKRGGYGVPGTTLGKLVHHSTDYDIDFEARKQERAEHLRKLGERRAFRPAGGTVTQQGTFDAPAKLLGTNEGCLPPKPDPLATKSAKEVVEAKQAAEGERKAFVPASPTKTGQLATLSPMPEAIPDPYDTWAIQQAMAPLRLSPQHKRLAQVPESLRERKAFSPAPGAKTGRTPSTYLMGIYQHHLADAPSGAAGGRGAAARAAGAAMTGGGGAPARAESKS